MASSVSHSLARSYDVLVEQDALVQFPNRTVQSNSSENDQFQLLEDTLSSLQTLYDSNAELNRELEGMKAKTSEAELLVEKWQKLASAAVTRAKEVETQFSVLESRTQIAEQQLQDEKDRANAAERRALDSEEALTTYKQQFTKTFAKHDQAHGIIDALRARTVPSTAGTHFRVVRKSSGWDN